MKYIVAPFLVVALLFQTACSQSQVTETLALVTAAADAAVGVLAPGTQALVVPYLNEVTSATDFAVTELQSTDAPGVKAAKIAAQFASVVAPQLPPGTASTIVLAVGAVGKAITAFLATLNPAATTAAHALTLSKTKTLKLSGADKKALSDIKTKNDVVKLKLASKK